MAQTMVTHFRDNVARFPDRHALVYRHGEEWRHITWAQYGEMVSLIARSLIKAAVQPGQVVAIVAGNRYEWLVSYVAALSVGAVPTGIYPTSTPEQVAYILAHSEAPVVVVENAAQLAKVRARKAELPAMRHIILLDGRSDGKDCLTWKDSMEAGSTLPPSAVDVRVARIDPTGLATLIYTSGTTGPPKAVMLSHANLRATSEILMRVADVTGEECTVSYLPLSHIAEQMNSIHLPIFVGACVWFAEALDKVRDCLLAARPHLFFAVPRVWEKFQAAIEVKLGAARGVQASLLKWACDVAEQHHQLKEEGKVVPAALGLKYKLAQALVFKKVKAGLGLERVRYFVSGAAPIGRTTLLFFRRLDIPIREIYGQSEGTGVASFNTHEKHGVGTVGAPLPGVEVKIAEDGEILVKGPNVFMGYYKEQKATAETLQGGYLHSGDVGAFDEKGLLKITDRKKDLIITAGGKNVAPQNIEQGLKAIPEISQAAVFGDRQKYLVALLTLDAEATLRWAHQRDLDCHKPGDVAGHPDLLAHIATAVDALNQSLAPYESIKRFRVLPEDFSVDSGELTPTLKLKRKVVNERYAGVFRELYGEDFQSAR